MSCCCLLLLLYVAAYMMSLFMQMLTSIWRAYEKSSIIGVDYIDAIVEVEVEVEVEHGRQP